MSIGEPIKTIYRFLTVFFTRLKIYFWPSGALCFAGALGPGRAGLCLKTALPSRQRTPGQNPPRTIEREFVQGAFVRGFCTRPTKLGGLEMFDVLFGGRGSEMCDKV